MPMWHTAYVTVGLSQILVSFSFLTLGSVCVCICVPKDLHAHIHSCDVYVMGMILEYCKFMYLALK